MRVEPSARAITETIKFSPNWLDGQILSYEVAKRRGKRLQQIRALKRAIKSAGANHPKVHLILTDWILTRDQIEIEDQDVKTVLDEQNKTINESLSDTCPSRNNQNFLRGWYLEYLKKISKKNIFFQIINHHSHIVWPVLNLNFE